MVRPRFCYYYRLGASWCLWGCSYLCWYTFQVILNTIMVLAFLAMFILVMFMVEGDPDQMPVLAVCLILDCLFLYMCSRYAIPFVRCNCDKCNPDNQSVDIDDQSADNSIYGEDQTTTFDQTTVDNAENDLGLSHSDNVKAIYGDISTSRESLVFTESELEMLSKGDESLQSLMWFAFSLSLEPFEGAQYICKLYDDTSIVDQSTVRKCFARFAKRQNFDE